MGVSLIKLKST